MACFACTGAPPFAKSWIPLVVILPSNRDLIQYDGDAPRHYDTTATFEGSGGWESGTFSSAWECSQLEWALSWMKLHTTIKYLLPVVVLASQAGSTSRKEAGKMQMRVCNCGQAVNLSQPDWTSQNLTSLLRSFFARAWQTNAL